MSVTTEAVPIPPDLPPSPPTPTLARKRQVAGEVGKLVAFLKFLEAHGVRACTWEDDVPAGTQPYYSDEIRDDELEDLAYLHLGVDSVAVAAEEAALAAWAAAAHKRIHGQDASGDPGAPFRGDGGAAATERGSA